MVLFFFVEVVVVDVAVATEVVALELTAALKDVEMETAAVVMGIYASLSAAAAAMMGAAASLTVVVETADCSCPFPNNPATRFDGENDEEPRALVLAAAVAGLSII